MVGNGGVPTNPILIPTGIRMEIDLTTPPDINSPCGIVGVDSVEVP